MLTKFLGLWLMADGFFSLLLVYDKKWSWQLARVLRMFVGMLVWMV